MDTTLEGTPKAIAMLEAALRGEPLTQEDIRYVIMRLNHTEKMFQGYRKLTKVWTRRYNNLMQDYREELL
jgi:hypothetical protein